jgi:translation initiation factor 2-alpha kinase 3
MSLPIETPHKPDKTANHLDSSSPRDLNGRPNPSSDSSTKSLESQNMHDEEDSVAGVVTRAIATNFPLSDIQSNQHTTTFLFSLIEGRCRSQARSIINSERHHQDQLSENHPEVCTLADSIFTETVIGMKKAGLIPEEVAIPGPLERRDYLRAFDTRLNDIATQQQPVNSVKHLTYDTIKDSKLYSIAEEASSLFERSQSQSQSHSRALIPKSFMTAPRGISASPLQTLMFPSGINAYQQESPYYRKFREICLLGKGGFGQVFRARHNLDDQDYAVKKIRVSASQLRSIHNQVQLDHLLKELRALAKLQHRNVVRYYDSWCEYRPPSWRGVGTGQHLLENGPDDLR